MKPCRVCREVKTVDEFSPRRDAKDGLRSECRACHAEANKKWVFENIDKVRALGRAATASWRARNPERAAQSWRQSNARQGPEKYARYRAKNSEKLKKYHQEYRALNKHIFVAKQQKRHAAKLSATPAWADLEAIKKFYEEAERVTAETGVRHEVDHIIPLQGKNVCGMHVQNNLRVIPQSENRKKSNKFQESNLLCREA